MNIHLHTSVYMYIHMYICISIWFHYYIVVHTDLQTSLCMSMNIHLKLYIRLSIYSTYSRHSARHNTPHTNISKGKSTKQVWIELDWITFVNSITLNRLWIVFEFSKYFLFLCFFLLFVSFAYSEILIWKRRELFWCIFFHSF